MMGGAERAFERLQLPNLLILDALALTAILINNNLDHHE